MKKFLTAILLISIIAIVLAVVMAGINRLTPLGSVVGMYADKKGYFYYLKVEGAGYYYYKLDSDSKIIKTVKLPEKHGTYFYSYNEIAADDNGNVYIGTYEKDELQYIHSKYVQVLDEKGHKVKKLFESSDIGLDKTETLERLQFNDGEITMFETAEDGRLKLFIYNCQAETETFTDYIFENQTIVEEAFYAKDGSVYYISDIGELYRVNPDGERKKIDVSYDDKDKAVVYRMSEDNRGYIYFTDVYNFTYLKYDPKKETFELIYNKNSVVYKDTAFKDLRFVRFYNGTLYAHSPIFEQQQAFLMKIDEAPLKIENKISRGMNLVLYAAEMFLVFFAVILFFVIIVYFVVTLRKLIVKQILLIAILMSMPIIYMTFASQRTLTHQVKNEIYLQLCMSAAGISAGIDGEKFSKLDFPKDINNEYMKELESKIAIDIENFKYPFEDPMPKNLYYTLYYIEGHEAFIGYGFDQMSGMQDCYMIKQAHEFLDSDHDYSPKNIEYRDRYGVWITGRAFIFDGNKAVGFLEIGTRQDIIDDKILSITLTNMRTAFIIEIVFVFVLSLTLRKLLKGIRILKEGLRTMTDGNWNVKILIKSGDEIEDIANDFNKMSLRIEKYVDSITKLNEAYEKFVPNELFEILDKENIFEVKLGDQSNKNVTLMSVGIKDFYSISRSMTTDECFEMLNALFGTSSQVIRDKGGVVESFGGFGLRALFTNETDYAIDAALRIIERINVHNKERANKIELNITVQNGDSMVGIAGDYNRMVETVVSQTVNNIFALERITEAYKIRLLVTQKALDKIVRKDKYNYCYIGEIKDDIEGCFIKIYDFFDSYELVKKNKMIAIKKDFEKGISLYMEGNFSEARKRFVDVLRVDRSYEIAKVYLFRCNKDSGDNGEGTILL